MRQMISNPLGLDKSCICHHSSQFRLILPGFCEILNELPCCTTPTVNQQKNADCCNICAQSGFPNAFNALHFVGCMAQVRYRKKQPMLTKLELMMCTCDEAAIMAAMIAASWRLVWPAWPGHDGHVHRLLMCAATASSQHPAHDHCTGAAACGLLVAYYPACSVVFGSCL